MVRTTLLQHK
jgi:hypothetical protein